MKTYDQIQVTHQLYCSLTGLNLPFSINQLYAWEMFCSRFTDDDLRTVVKFVKDRIKNGRPARSFTFRNFISGPNSLDFFAEDLCEAKAEARQKPSSPARVAVLKASGRPPVPSKKIMTPAEIMEQSKIMAESLRAFRESL